MQFLLMKKHFVWAMGTGVLGMIHLFSAIALRGEGEMPQGGSIPDAIIGKGVPPRGVEVAYFKENPKAIGYLAVPEGEGPRGAIILVHEWNGLVDRLKQIADVFAEEGYVALAADLYSGRIGHNRDENMALVNEVRGNEKRMIANLDAAARFLRSRPDVSGKIAAMGWCFGGGVALNYALGGENHEATAIFYGHLIDDPVKLRSIHHEIYGTFAGLDKGIPPSTVERFVKALRKAGVPNDVHIYDDVHHGFWLWVDRDPEKYREPASDAWLRLKAYLERTIGSEASQDESATPVDIYKK